MKGPAGAGIAAGIALALGTVLSIAQPRSDADRISVPLKQWVALDMPLENMGPMGEMKHLTGAYHPDSGRIYFTGGDYRGKPYGQSYRQETWSLSLTERWKDRGNRNAGWQLEYPYCGPAGQVQPKHPDFVGWTWDTKRKVFWMVPGVMEISNHNCPGETGSRESDPGFLAYRIMQFEPETRRWQDVGGNIGVTADTWMSVYDPKNDTLIRFAATGGSGPMVSIYRINENKWVNRDLPRNALGKDIRIKKEYLAVDYDRRVIYAIDGIAGRLHRYSMDKQSIEDLGPVPTGAYGHENYMYTSWDSTAKVLLWVRDDPPSAHVYTPDTKTWDTLSLTADNPAARVTGRTLVYDPFHNVTLMMGGYTENPHMFLFRYGEGR